jgi:hypothetical protein
MLPMDCKAPHSSKKAHEEELARLDSIIRTLRKVSHKETMFHRMRSCHSFTAYHIIASRLVYRKLARSDDYI